MEIIKSYKLTVWFVLFILAWGALAWSTLASARTSMVALPLRQDTRIKLGSQNFTLVQEKRILTLKKGNNKIDFSWQNVMIDPFSIQLYPQSGLADIKIISISYPPNESALVWDIYSSMDVAQEVTISYLLANIDGLTTYLAVADPDEKTIQLKSFMVLRNFSGEDFDKAAISINNSKPFVTRIDHLETKRLLVSAYKDIPVKKIYTWDAAKMPHDPQKARTAVGIPVSYELQNTNDANLGHSALMKGKVRVFQDDRQGGTLFLGEDICPFTPIGENANLHIGDSRDIVVTQRTLGKKRSNIQRNKKGKIQLYDESYSIQITMENMKDSQVTLTLLETIPGQWKPEKISMAYELVDHQTLKFAVQLSAKQKRTLQLNYKILNIFAGSFSRYNRARY